MAYNDYVGSLANTAINYSTLITTTTVPGQNYYQIGLFVDSVVDAPNNLNSGYVVNTPIALNFSNYTSYAKSGSNLLAWLSAFFAVNTTSTVFVVVYNGATHDIPTAHQALLTLSYFKMVFFGSNGETVQYQSDAVALAGQQALYPLVTQALVNTSNALVLTPSGSGSGTLDQLIVASGYDAMMTYSAQTSSNPLFTAIGLSISSYNPTGSPVGNDIDFNGTAFSNILPSTGQTPSTYGTNVNLSAIQTTNLASRKIGYFATVGDGTGNVYMNARFSLLGQVIGARWLVNYCNFVCSLKTATYLATGGFYSFKNNVTYQAILGIINSVISPFQTTSLQRLSNFTITAPTFGNLPQTGGTVITIPNAWSANYNDRIGSVNVQGTLNVTL